MSKAKHSIKRYNSCQQTSQSPTLWIIKSERSTYKWFAYFSIRLWYFITKWVLIYFRINGGSTPATLIKFCNRHNFDLRYIIIKSTMHHITHLSASSKVRQTLRKIWLPITNLPFDFCSLQTWSHITVPFSYHHVACYYLRRIQI
jgi:hypothetical protein